MGWIILGVVVVAFLLSAGAGTWASYDAPKPSGDEQAADKCALCWDKFVYSGWDITRGAVCVLKGC